MLAASQASSAQTPIVVVRGVAFDSLRGQPLRGALVVVLGAAQVSTTDSQGRFRFDSVPTGRHTFVVQHVVLDSVGFSGLSKRATIRDGTEEVLVAVPSFSSLWRLACDSVPPKSDTGFVYGTIRGAVDGLPVAGAFVDLTWDDLDFDKSNGLTKRRVHGAARTDSVGSYTVCGVPVRHWLRIDAGAASGASGQIDLPPTDLHVQRRDLLIGYSASADSTRRGTISGLLTGGDGTPFADALVIVDDTTEVRTDADGRFIVSNVPIGTRQVEVLSIGMVPVVTAVNVLPLDTARVAMELRKVTMLDVVRVTASRRGRMIVAALEERKRNGFGHLLEAGDIARHPTLSGVFSNLPGLTVRQSSGDVALYAQDGRGGECTLTVFIDGARMAFAALSMVQPHDLLAVELFARAQSVPLEFRNTERKTSCGVILLWTARSFR
jgi:hypothetical protein